MRLESPWALALLILVPIVAWRLLSRRRSGSVRFSSIAPLLAGPRGVRSRVMWFVPVLQILAMCAMIVALARPQEGKGRIETTTEAVAIEMVIDRSGSMGERMIYDGRGFTRLDVVKLVLREFVLGDDKTLAGRKGDMMGLVSFARYPETVCPLVTDHQPLVELADRVRLAQRPVRRDDFVEDGTAIGDAIALAGARLEREAARIEKRQKEDGDDSFTLKSKVIILLTDGQDNASEMAPLEAAKMAAEWGIRIYTIGIGSTSRGLFADRGLDEPTLRAIADATGGVYRRATDADSLRQIYDEIETLEKSSVRTIQFTDYEEKFGIPATIGLALLGLAMMLDWTLLRRSP